MSTSRALRQPLALRLTSAGFLAFWCLLATFPLFWILVMSFKIPVDSFAANPLSVIFGPATRAAGKGVSIVDIVIGGLVLWWTARLAMRGLPKVVEACSPPWSSASVSSSSFSACCPPSSPPLTKPWDRQVPRSLG